MKNLSLVFLIFYISISFAQSKNKETTINSLSKPKTEVILCCCKEETEIINDENKIYSTAAVDVRPELLGWVKKEQFIKDNFKTPIVNGEKITGKVYVAFVIEKDGTISNITILRDVGHGTGEEAKRVLKNMPRWNPAKKGGKIVRSMYSMPIILP